MEKHNETHIALFRGKGIRKAIHNNEWWFSVTDICAALTESVDAGAYWRKLKQRLSEEGSEVVTNCHGLKLEAPDGKMRETDCSNTEGVFRIIQSIPLNDLEQIFSMLGEAATTEIARNKDARGYHENKKVANEGGQVAGKARKDLEKRSGKKVITKENYLGLDTYNKLRRIDGN
ncbi:Bro-N domain-containing protein [Candidatus Saganbacteria bacterium]|nr:Bro-N domain-containing protein [Candidatus Saganbacteria bacterium]